MSRTRLTNRMSSTLVLSAILMVSCNEMRDEHSSPGRDTTIDGKHSFVPEHGVVPDSFTAVRIAEAVLVPVYGEDVIAEQKPLVARLQGGIWHVSGTLPAEHVGGVAIVELAKEDGRVLRISHGL